MPASCVWEYLNLYLIESEYTLNVYASPAEDMMRHAALYVNHLEK